MFKCFCCNWQKKVTTAQKNQVLYVETGFLENLDNSRTAYWNQLFFSIKMKLFEKKNQSVSVRKLNFIDKPFSCEWLLLNFQLSKSMSNILMFGSLKSLTVWWRLMFSVSDYCVSQLMTVILLLDFVKSLTGVQCSTFVVSD